MFGPGGMRGTASERSIAEARGRTGVRIELDDGRSIVVPREALAPEGRGVRRVAGERMASREREVAAAEKIVIPAVREELDVGKRRVDRGGVRVRVIPGERREVVDVPLEHRDLRVERVQIGREVEGPLQAREEDGVLIFPVVEEVLVVQKKWVLREEVRIRVERTRTRASEAVSLRTERVSIERLGRDDRSEAEGGTGEPAAGPGDRRGRRSRTRR